MLNTTKLICVFVVFALVATNSIAAYMKEDQRIDDLLLRYLLERRASYDTRFIFIPPFGGGPVGRRRREDRGGKYSLS